MVEATSGERHELERAEDFWDVALGSGYRATVDALGDEHRDRLRERVIGELRARSVTSLRSDVVSMGDFGVSFTWRIDFPAPCNNRAGSRSAAPRKNPTFTCEVKTLT